MKTFEDFAIPVPPNASGNTKTVCPQCSATRKNPRDKCLSVNVAEGIWVCHNCDWRGSLREPGDFPTGPRRSVPKVYAKPEVVAEPKLLPGAMQFLVKRGISEVVIERFGLYSQKVWMPQTEADTVAVAFPYFRDGKLINVKYRDAKKNFRMVKDAEKILYNLDACKDAATVMICEGEMDVLACATAGITAVLSVPNGAPPTSAEHPNMDYLASGEAVFAAATKIVIAVDNDGPGQRLEAELARRIGREKCWRVTWPAGTKDANDVLMQHGVERLAACLNDATPYPVEGIITVRDVEDQVWSLYTDGLPRGVSTGWRDLDEYYTVKQGQLTVVTGSPGSGKSNVIDHLCVHVAALHDWRIGMCSPENQPVARHIAGLAAKHQAAPFADGPTPRMGVEDLDAALAFIHEHFAFILPEEPTLAAILDRARVLVLRMGIQGLVVDPWNELDHSRPQGLTETEYISQCLTRIRQFARHNGVHVWVVAHPTKLIKGSDGQYPVPTPYDISGAAHWFNKADNCLAVWRDKTDDRAPVDLHIQKVRFAEVGKLGMTRFAYNLATSCYRDLSPNEKAVAS